VNGEESECKISFFLFCSKSPGKPQLSRVQQAESAPDVCLLIRLIFCLFFRLLSACYADRKAPSRSMLGPSFPFRKKITCYSLENPGKLRLFREHNRSEQVLLLARFSSGGCWIGGPLFCS
jgi:hypothetical protein